MDRADQLILYADDDDDDYMLMKKAFKDFRVQQQLKWVQNGQEVLDYLLKQGNFQGDAGDMPVLVLMDLNMPMKTGKEALLDIRKYEQFSDIPIVIMTTASAEEAGSKFDEGVTPDAFIKKPVSFAEYGEVVGMLKQRWLGGL